MSPVRIWAGPLRCVKIKFEVKPFYVVVIILLLLAVFVLKPFLGTIISAVVLAYLSHPLYDWLTKKLRRKSISALFTVLIVIILITGPTIFALNALSKEIFAGYLITKQFVVAGAQNIDCKTNSLCSVFDFLGFSEPTVINFLNDTLGKATAAIFNKLTGYVISLPKVIANIFITVFLTYYLLKDGPSLIERAKRILPISKPDQELILKRFNSITYAVVWGNVIVAVVQGILTSIGFFIFGVTSPLIWGVVTMFTSLIPFLGAFIVWLPAALFLIISGFNSGEGITLLSGLGLFLYGLFIISGVDNIAKPRIISGRANLHPALVLLGVIGGLSVLGVPGIILGPVLIGLAVTIVDIASRYSTKNT